MKKRSFKQELWILITCFLISRMIIKLLGVSFGYSALFEYWQYLDVQSLRTNLLKSLWYQHSQPPVFNFLLGIVLKLGGKYNPYLFELLLMLFSFCNALLLLRILKLVRASGNLALIFSLVYLLSPATMLYENELFYTSFISLLLLLALYYMILLEENSSWTTIAGVFGPLTLLCLTRSMYHLVWLTAIGFLLLLVRFNREDFKRILFFYLLSMTLVGGWYLKNYVIFKNFSASSWVGMNFSRIVFHDKVVTDPGNIASIHPFMPISFYNSFIRKDYKKQYAGMNDRILLMETKNGPFINMNNAGYLEVSKKYAGAAINEISQTPAYYLKNAGTAFIIFFTSASSYFKLAGNSEKIRYYDMLFSVNPAHLFKENNIKKQALAIAAIPRFCLYFFTIFILLRTRIKTTRFRFPNIFIVTTILFSLFVGCALDYGENMRFRFEVEPLFLVLLAQVIISARQKTTMKTNG